MGSGLAQRQSPAGPRRWCGRSVAVITFSVNIWIVSAVRLTGRLYDQGTGARWVVSFAGYAVESGLGLRGWGTGRGL